MKTMSEPVSSSGAAGFAAYKLAMAYGVPACLAAVLVMLIAQPKSKREWAAALISTVSGSIYGGAFAIRYFGLHTWTEEVDSAVMLGGVYLVCGLPAWVLIRAGFAWVERRKSKDIAELALDAQDAFNKVRGGGK